MSEKNVVGSAKQLYENALSQSDWFQKLTAVYKILCLVLFNRAHLEVCRDTNKELFAKRMKLLAAADELGGGGEIDKKLATAGLRPEQVKKVFTDAWKDYAVYSLGQLRLKKGSRYALYEAEFVRRCCRAAGITPADIHTSEKELDACAQYDEYATYARSKPRQTTATLVQPEIKPALTVKKEVKLSKECECGEHDKCPGSGGATPESIEFDAWICSCDCHDNDKVAAVLIPKPKVGEDQEQKIQPKIELTRKTAAVGK